VVSHEGRGLRVEGGRLSQKSNIPDG